MTYLYDLPNNTTNIDRIFLDSITAVPSFIPIILAFVFFVVFLGGIAREKQRIGTASYSMWAVVASMSTFIIALIMSVVSGVISLTWLGVVIAITIMSGVWFFLDKSSSNI